MEPEPPRNSEGGHYIREPAVRPSLEISMVKKWYKKEFKTGELGQNHSMKIHTKELGQDKRNKTIRASTGMYFELFTSFFFGQGTVY